MLDRTRTIVAPATPPGVGALAVVRLSGPACSGILRDLLGVADPVARQMRLVRVLRADGSLLDEPLCAWFPAPRSYTGEEVLELYPHGNPLIVRELLHLLCAYPGVGLAEPGEFTRRAFENGKLDLVQAEAVAATIHARTEAALRNARLLAEGCLSKEIGSLVEAVVELSALMELEVDFAEEEAEPEMSSWPERLREIRRRIGVLRASWERGQRASRLPRVVLCGAPNAGKSSLANALLGEDRLLVSDQAGTTRDWVETHLLLEGGEVALCDTAGLTELRAGLAELGAGLSERGAGTSGSDATSGTGARAVDELDRRSQERTRQLLATADLLLWVEDGREACAPDDLREQVAPGRPWLKVRTRADLPGFVTDRPVLSVSCTSGEGIAELRSALSSRLFAEAKDAEFFLATERQAEAMREADGYLAEALERFAGPGIGRAVASPEVLAFDLQQARRALESLTGVISSDQILGRIFAGFCIGK